MHADLAELLAAAYNATDADGHMCTMGEGAGLPGGTAGHGAEQFHVTCPACFLALHARAMRNPGETLPTGDPDVDRCDRERRTTGEVVNEVIRTALLPLPLVPEPTP